MRHKTTLPILLLALAAAALPASAQTLPSVSIATFPAHPAPGDEIVLKLSGQWPDGCVPETGRTKLTTSGTKLHVNFNYSGIPGPCTAAVTPWTLDVPVGALAAGAYTVEVTRTRTFSAPEPIGNGAFSVVPLAASTVYVPGFFAPGATVSMASTLAAYNNTDKNVTVEFAGAWDGLGAAPTPADAAVGPNAAVILDSHTLRAGQHVQMLAITAPRRVALRATLERLETVPEGLPKVPESLGRLELPVFGELFPAGMTAIAGDVSLSASECAEGATNRRRVNLTLFNAGDAAATFRVSAVSATAGPGGPASEKEYSVPASSIVQFNELPLEGLPVCAAGGAWFRITGDQPFLAYLSTVRSETLPGVLPYEIFPAKLDR
ncbi:MAG: hypothetical protein ACYC4P_00865 [Thermoanaerobaculia bacterium]